MATQLPSPGDNHLLSTKLILQAVCNMSTPGKCLVPGPEVVGGGSGHDDRRRGPTLSESRKSAAADAGAWPMTGCHMPLTDAKTL